MKKLILFISFIVVALTSQATVWVVDSLNDSGYGSLRAAADSALTGDTIRFNPNLIANGSDSIVLTTGEISFDTIGVVITGLYNATDTLFISGGNNYRLLSFIGAGKIVLDSVVFINGNGNGGSYNGYGGAILSYNCFDTLLIVNSFIKNNSAFHYGGGVCVFSDTASNYSTALKVVQSSIVGNKSEMGGGCFISSQTSTSSADIYVLNSVISNNSALSGDGGGIFCQYDFHTSSNSNCKVDLLNSTVSENSSNMRGGGIYANSGGSPASTYVTISRSTLSGNHAKNNGGAVFSSSPSTYLFTSSNVKVESSTIVGNSVSLYDGGGIFSYSFTSSSLIEVLNSTIYGNVSTLGIGNGIGAESNSSSIIKIEGSIVAENGNGSSGISNVMSPSILSNGYNVFSDTLLGTIATDSTNISNAQLNLQALDFYGGTTKTMGLGVGSVALNCGNPNDSSDAQNIPIVGVRDRGATEYCVNTYRFDTVSTCGPYLWVDGITYYSSTNTPIHKFSNAAGCDSIVMLNLTIHPTTFKTDSIESCNSYTWIDGITYYSSNTTARDTLINQYGCDSVVNLNLIIHQEDQIIDVVTSCDSITWINGVTYTSSTNSVQDTLVNRFGCDSIISLDLTITNTTHGIEVVSACDSYLWNGINYTSSTNTALDTLVNAAGCDSIVTLNLTVNYSNTFTDTITACNSYTWIDGVTYYQSNNTAQHTLINAGGCDSLVTLNLTISNTYIDTVVACDSYTWRNGVTYTQSGYGALDTVVVSGSCDSLFILDLTIHSTEYATDTLVGCDSLTWINGVTYYSSTSSVYDTLVNRNGCDSIVTLDLTIKSSVHDTDHVNGCYFYTWSNGQVFVFDNNTATQVFTGSNGCDSILHLDLEIHIGTNGTDTQVVCDSLVWIDGNTYYSNNTTALHTLVGGNSYGCDSTVTLNLTVNGTQTTDVISSCDSYTWLDGITYTTSNNTATYVTTNSLGCDSTVNLDLTILQPSSATDIIAGCDAITWIDGNTYTSSDNTATYTLTNAVGCDSVVTLDFTRLDATQGTDVISSCIPITWIDGMVYDQSISGPTYTMTNANGCDSVVTLDLTILDVDTSVTRNYLTLTAQAANATYQWIDCDDGVLAGETGASFTATVNGNYQVEVTQNGCVDTSDCFSITNVGVQEAELMDISLYPNPTSDVLNIDKGSNSELEITITNSAGAVVYQSVSKNQVTTVNMSQMASGTYIVTLKNQDGLKVEQVVKR